jgi:hypothetical protein
MNDFGCGDNTCSDHVTCNNIWDTAAQDFIEYKTNVSTDFQEFYEGISCSHLCSTPVKSKMNTSFHNFDNDCKMSAISNNHSI